MASKEYGEFLEELFSMPIVNAPTMDQVREGFEETMSHYPPDPEVRFADFSIGPIAASWAFAPKVKREKVILFFFGGGYSAGSIRSHKGLMSQIAKGAHAPVLGFEYRLAPEHPFPSALEDALTVYRWLIHHPYPHNHIAFVGVSAGGGLLLSLLQRIKLENMALPAGGVCICPWVDLSKREYANRKDLLNPTRLAKASEMYRGGKDAKDPFVSPLYGNLEEMPPLLIQTGTRDLLYEEAVELVKKLTGSKLESWPEMIHCWHLFAGRFPEAKEGIDQLCRFLKPCLKI